MDHIYKPRLKSESYKKETFDKFAKDVKKFSQPNMTIEQVVEVHQSRIGPISEQRLRNIIIPNLSEISEPYFLHRMNKVTVPAAAHNFKCVRKAKAANSKNTEAKQHKVQLTPIPSAQVEGLKSVTKPDETIFTVKIYEPFKYICASRKIPKIVEEIQVLGSHKLTVLRDNIQCYVGPFLDISDNPDEVRDSEDSVDSAFIFVNDTFYNDYRNPAAQDYSEPILTWLKEKGRKNVYKTAGMEDTPIADLEFKLGFPYVYQHYGNCEHLIIFVDVRMATETERLNAKLFPMVKRFIGKGMYCIICGLNEATFVVVESTEHIQDPSFICQQCLQMYHYKDGKKLGDFKAYRLTNKK